MTYAACRAARLAVLALLLALPGYARALPALEPDSEPEFLVLEVRLDQSVLSGAIPAYEVGEHTLLPLGELARLLTLAVQTRPGEGTASGFILSEDRGFSLSLNDARVTRAGRTERFEPALVLAEPDDLYVAISLLERWLPLTLDVDRASLSLRVHALETLPLQARLARERLAERMGKGGGYQSPGYPYYELPYRLLSLPFIDQTFSTQLSHGDAGTQSEAGYTAFLTGDLLGMESAIYFSSQSQDSSPNVRATLGRYDPEGQLLGPLHARTLRFGSLSAPSVKNVTGGAGGEGITVSNRSLSRPTSFDQQTFEGDLPPGWDLELYYNDALVDFQRPNAEGRYRFEDQLLSYGRNDFRLVFNGPLGQTRVEQYSFPLDQSMTRPGEFEYSLTEHRDEKGQARSVAQFDLGVARALSASLGLVRTPVNGDEEQYTTLGLRTYWQALSIGGDFVRASDGGALAELGVKTRFGGVTVDANHIQLNDFNSNVFSAGGDPIRTRDKLRLSGAIPVGSRSRLPVTLSASRDERESGMANTEVSARISGYAYRTSISNTLNWRSAGDEDYTSGSLQLSRRVYDTSVRSQVNYALGAEGGVSLLALSADKSLADGYRGSLGVAHTLTPQATRYSAGFSKSIGRYGLGLSTSYSDSGEVAVGAQFFIAIGRDPRRSDWRFNARPMANSGAASVLMFMDDNNNGVMDPGEEPLEGAGFTVNGSRHQARTDAAGIAYIDYLPVKQYVDIGVDTSTLMDPQWAPEVEGFNLIPRPSAVARLEFPVRMTTEIDGTAYLVENGAQRGIGDLKLELLNDQHEIVAEATSSWDGFYIVPGVVAGDYWLRASPRQLQRLGLTDTGMQKLSVSGDGSFISGIDIMILPLACATDPAQAERAAPGSQEECAEQG